MGARAQWEKTTMPIFRLRGRREALPYNSKMYKNKIIEYLESRGYFVIATSEEESIFSDVIFQHKYQSIENWLEVKATSVSLNNADFIKQLSDYLVEYLKLTRNNRFKFWLAAFKLISDPFKKVFDELDETAIRDLIQKMVLVADEKKSEIIKNAAFIDIKQFFETSTIIEGYPEDISRTKEKISPEAPTTPKFDDVEYASEIMKNYGDIEPLIEEHTGFVNLFPIVLPEKISWATTPFSNHIEIYKIKPQMKFPVFRLENKILYTFEDLENSLLRQYVNIHTIVTKKVDIWLEENKKNENIIVNILNKWIGNCCREMMWYDKRTGTYYFPRPKGWVRPLSKTWVSPKGVKSTRIVTKPYRTENRINFWAHRSVQVRAFKKWGDYSLYIRPRWSFSEDGYDILLGDKADRLDRLFRNPLYNRNKNALYDLLFWYDILFKHTTKDASKRLETFTLLDSSPNIEVLKCIEFKLYRKPNSEIEDEQEVDAFDIVLKLDDFV